MITIIDPETSKYLVIVKAPLKMPQSISRYAIGYKAFYKGWWRRVYKTKDGEAYLNVNGQRYPIIFRR